MGDLHNSQPLLGSGPSHSSSSSQGSLTGLARLGQHVPTPWACYLTLRGFSQSPLKVRTVAGNQVGTMRQSGFIMWNSRISQEKEGSEIRGDRERWRGRDRDRNKQRNREKQRQKGTGWERDRRRQRETGTEDKTDREKHRGREKQTEEESKRVTERHSRLVLFDVCFMTVIGRVIGAKCFFLKLFYIHNSLISWYILCPGTNWHFKQSVCFWCPQLKTASKTVTHWALCNANQRMVFRID